jgi:CYTH domain-containing protein
MGKEIERKFRVTTDEYKKLAEPVYYQQGYLTSEPGKTVRVRIAGEKAFLTLKGKSSGISRSEYEYEIPVCDAEEMLANLACSPIIKKYRYKIPFGKHIWEVDKFLGDNEGLIVAEIELSAEDEAFEKPDWIGDEVSYDKRYYNSRLSLNPYKNW